MSENNEIAAKYRKQLYYYLRDDYDGSNRVIARDSEKDSFVIRCYEDSIRKLGFIPDTEEVIKEAQHDNFAVLLRLEGERGLETFFYEFYKPIMHLIENKECYKGKEIRGLDIWGIGPKAITLGNIKTGDGYTGPNSPNIWCENKDFHNYFNDDGDILAKEIVEKYGYLSWEKEGKKQKKEMQEMYGGY